MDKLENISFRACSDALQIETENDKIKLLKSINPEYEKKYSCPFIDLHTSFNTHCISLWQEMD